jgi:hypothetical protein
VIGDTATDGIPVFKYTVCRPQMKGAPECMLIQDPAWRFPLLLKEPQDKTNTEDTERTEGHGDKKKFMEEEKTKAKAISTWFGFFLSVLSFPLPYLNNIAISLWPSESFVFSVFVLCHGLFKMGNVQSLQIAILRKHCDLNEYSPFS